MKEISAELIVTLILVAAGGIAALALWIRDRARERRKVSKQWVKWNEDRTATGAAAFLTSVAALGLLFNSFNAGSKVTAVLSFLLFTAALWSGWRQWKNYRALKERAKLQFEKSR